MCTLCGACASMCPYLRSWKGRIVKLHDCDLPEGRCFAYCPRAEVDLGGLHRGIFGDGEPPVEMGPFKRVLMARAADGAMRRMAQTGAAVSALISFALGEGMVQGAVLTWRDAEQLPGGRVARGPGEVLACAGSSYVAGPTLEALNQGPWQEGESVAVVGIPCQVLALAKMRLSTLERRSPADRVGLVIGLFCTWALEYAPFMAFLRQRFGGAAISKLDITPPPDRLLKVTTDRGVHDVSLEEVRPFVRSACGVCADMTGELADISVGTVEGTEGWNTVIVRTDRGEALVARAVAAGVLETELLPASNLAHLQEASLLKKRRALEALDARGEPDGGYLRLPRGWAERILGEREGVRS